MCFHFLTEYIMLADRTINGEKKTSQLFIYFSLINNRARRMFIVKEQYIDEAKRRCSTYFWGGRQEQDLMDKMKVQESEGQKVPEESTAGSISKE